MADRHVEIAGDDLGAASKTLAGLDLDLLLFMDVGMDPLVSTLAFSRFAPVQVATWGHPVTTGSPCIDYFLSSDGLDPDNGAEHYTEQVVRLPSLGIVYDPPEFRPAITRGTLGLPEGRRLYVCPQTLFKLHPDIDELFREILTADAGGEIVLLDGGVPEWRHRLHRRLLRTLPHSCDERIRFLSAPLPRDVFLSLLRLADVVLDPPHFGGGNTSIEAVSMGAPVVTLEGLFLRSRITATLLRDLGVTELIAADDLTYCDLAVNIAGDRQLREQLSQRLSTAAQKLYKNNAGHQLEGCLLDLLSRCRAI